MKENFYALEGLDGVGKSTVRDLLNQRGYVILKTPPSSFPIERSVYDNFEVMPRFLFFLMGVMQAGNEAEKISTDRAVICDRYLLTTVAAHEAMGLSYSFLSSILPLLKETPVPKNTFLLIASEEERIRRLTLRGANEIDIANLKINSQIFQGYKKWSLILGHKLSEVDTTCLPPKQVAEYIEDNIYSK